MQQHRLPTCGIQELPLLVPNQPAGTYSVTVTDNLGCGFSELTLASESDLNFQTTTKNPTCEAADDGNICHYRSGSRTV